MQTLEFELLKIELGYLAPIEVSDQNGTRQGNFLIMHDTDRDTFCFLNWETEQKETLSIADTQIRPL